MQCTDDSGDMVSSEEEAKLRREAVAWVIRLHNHPVSQEDRRAFEAWHAQSPAHALMFEKLLRVWDGPELREAAATSAKARAFASTVPSRRWPILAATCAILFLIIAISFDLVTRWQSDYHTGAGERRTVELPDRSIAILNTQSAIALSYDGMVRRIRLLKGEVFLQVQHDSDHPFVVESAETSVRALGTAFVVRARPSGDQITVLEGAVKVDSRRMTTASSTVAAGSQLQTEHGRLEQPQAVDVPVATAWLSGRLVVQGVAFAQVLEELQRYHPSTVLLLNQRVGNTNVTGTYNVEDPVGALALLVKTVPLSVISIADRLVILF